ncbi:MAG TPA: molybdopterin-dependent oxidoreductase, partial [Candidatus Polarisedimenticolaceae bacterium]|nr:molybdopterin-dependent oxidoreductase [Candidatus Polarisedimenticolaceae bacterium]
AVFSPRMTSESLFAWSALLQAAGGAIVAVARVERGADDELLIRRDRGANSTGARWVLGEVGTPDAVLEAVGAGRVDTLIVFGDPLDPDETPTVPDQARAALTELVYVGAFADAVASRAGVVLPVAAWAEEDGTIVNFEGRIQRVRRAHLPRGERRPAWRVAVDLARAAEIDLPQWSSAADVLASLGTAVAAYDGLDEETIGLLGIAATAAAAGA